MISSKNIDSKYYLSQMYLPVLSKKLDQKTLDIYKSVCLEQNQGIDASCKIIDDGNKMCIYYQTNMNEIRFRKCSILYVFYCLERSSSLYMINCPKFIFYKKKMFSNKNIITQLVLYKYSMNTNRIQPNQALYNIFFIKFIVPSSTQQQMYFLFQNTQVPNNKYILLISLIKSIKKLYFNQSIIPKLVNKNLFYLHMNLYYLDHYKLNIINIDQQLIHTYFQIIINSKIIVGNDLIKQGSNNFIGGMERLLKIVQNNSNSWVKQEKNIGIFDIHTYHKAIDRMSCSSSLEDILHNKQKNNLFSEPISRFAFSTRPFKHGIPLKQQIRPHQPHHFTNKIAQIFKGRKSSPRRGSLQSKQQQMIFLDLGKDKKASYSAYINARKKIIEKQSSLPHSSGTPNLNLNKGSIKSEGLIHIPEPKDKVTCISLSQTMRQTDVPKSQLQFKPQQKSKNVNNYITTMSKFQRIRLEGITTRKKLDPVTPKEPIFQIQGQLTQKIQLKTPQPRKSFITIIKKRRNDNSLMVNSRRKESLKKIQAEHQKQEEYHKYFLAQKSLTQEEIQIYPEISSLIKLTKNPQNDFDVEEVNSKSITVLHYLKGNVKTVFQRNEKQRSQIASITKTMTCFLVLIMAERFKINLHKQKLIVSERASKMPGTSAKLAYSDVLTIFQALHGLMLPSGNDAAIALGEWGGKQIRKYSSNLRRIRALETTDQTNQKSSSLINSLAPKRKSHLKLFVYHMNKIAKFLHLNSTHFVNTHGLMNDKAYSCSQNIALLTYYVMNNQIFRQIVEKKFYNCRIFNRTFSHTKQISWQNTNKLLGIQGFVGVKTGITPAAGPCLTSLFQISPDQYYITTILKTKSCEMRFKQTIFILQKALTALSQHSHHPHLYKKSLQNLEKYDKLDIKQDQKQNLNNFRQQTLSNNSDNQKDDQFFTNQIRWGSFISNPVNGTES